jgi:hypothetical protein
MALVASGLNCTVADLLVVGATTVKAEELDRARDVG